MIEREELVGMVAMADACLRYLVGQTSTAGIIRMPELGGDSLICEISSDHRLSYMRFSIFEDLLAPALVSPPGKRHYVDLSKLKVCPICDRLFVAGRSDAMACSTRCLSVERVRRHRDPEKQKEYRRQLEATRKGRDEVRKKIARKLSLQPASPPGGSRRIEF